jgi:hypothetical protein
LAVRVGRLMFTVCVLVFCECEAVNDTLTEGYDLKVFEYEMDEFNVLFKKFGVFS